MAKSPADIASDLDAELKQNGGSVMTFTWPEFYEITERARLKAPIPEKIKDEASRQYGLIVAYGMSTVLVAHDRNFSGRKRD